MKKKISLMLAAALTAGLALTGCGGSKTSDTTDNTAGAENESTAEVKGVDVDTTGYLVAALNADIQTADVQKTSRVSVSPARSSSAPLIWSINSVFTQ